MIHNEILRKIEVDLNNEMERVRNHYKSSVGNIATYEYEKAIIFHMTKAYESAIDNAKNIVKKYKQ